MNLATLLFYPTLVFTFLLPLVFSQSIVAVFTMPKLFLLRIFGAVILLLFAWALFKNKRPVFFRTRLNLFITLYGGWLILASLFSSALFVSLFGVENRFVGLFTLLNYLLLFFTALHFFGQRRFAIAFFHLGALTGLITALIGVFQFIYASFASVLAKLPFFDGAVPFFVYLSREKWLDILPKLDPGTINSYQLSFWLFYGLLLAGIAFVWAGSRLFTDRKHKIFIAVLIGAAFLALQKFSLNTALAEWSQAPQFRAFSTIGHGNHLGGFLAATLPLSIILFSLARDFSGRVIYGLSSVICFVALILTASRGAFFGLALAVFLVVAIGVCKYRARLLLIGRKFFWRVVIAAMVAALAVFFSWGKIATLPIVYRSVETVNFILAGNIPDRFSWWLSSWSMIKDHPVFGVGTEAYRNNYNFYRRADYRSPLNDQYGITPESSHFELLNIAATQGVIGLVLFLLLLIGAWSLMIKAVMRTADRENGLVIMGFFASSAAYIGQTMISFGVIATTTYFYFTLGLGAAAALESLGGERTELKISRRSWAAAALFSVAVLLFWLGVSQYRAHYYYSRGLEEEQRGRGNEALENYNNSIAILPLHYASYEKKGDIYLLTSNKQPTLPLISDFLNQAINSYGTSLYYSPGLPNVEGNIAQAYSKLAQVFALSGNRQGAAEALKKSKSYAAKAIALGPNNPIFAYTYGDILVEHGLYDEAFAAYKQAYDLDPDWQQVAFELSLAAFELKEYPLSRDYLTLAFRKEPENLDLHRLDTDLKKLGF